MRKNTKQKEEVQHICNRCSSMLPSNHLVIKTKRGTVMRLCDKCVKEGL